ncbi:hypothetical protein FA10DRAFT_264642 [Acaromyces ingoldii]|uniref:RING-type domain-containing protein n=1 Tax=Acaromyces ingoldii TaxID=215250 RepID=A0A316YXY2_9BASI|nr:hypothetical protein FA10DRAFT_264642 [Acaromyces ingoldii]PWN94051.1 hypothetical protein FA10DRAFT_264642 [Acaromyces ingoldii]
MTAEVVLSSLFPSSSSLALLPLLLAVRGLKLLHGIYERRIERLKTSDCVTAHLRLAFFFVFLLVLDGTLALHVLDALSTPGRAGTNGVIALVLATDVMALPAHLWRGTAAYFIGLHLSTFDESCSPRTRHMRLAVLRLTIDVIKLLNQLALLSCLVPAPSSSSSSSSSRHGQRRDEFVHLPLVAWQLAKTSISLYDGARAMHAESTRVKAVVERLPNASFLSSDVKGTIVEGQAAQDHACCLICREDMADGSGAKRLPCHHAFHARCISTWLDVRLQCPTCRKAV